MLTAGYGNMGLVRAFCATFSPMRPANTPRKMAEDHTQVLRPIERIGVNEQILSRLKEFLEQKHLKVGSRLPSERDLAALLRVSRPSVREVLRALAILGIVKSKQGDGTYLAASLHRVLNLPDQVLTLQESLDLVELAEARSAIEPVVTSLAAARASRDDLNGIHNQLLEMKRSFDDRRRFLQHDLEFHLSIMRACGNDVLKRMMSVVLEKLFDHSQQVAQNYSNLSGIWALHETVYKALCRRDARQARAAMVRHMKISRAENSRFSVQSPKPGLSCESIRDRRS
jgi:GntR family transcriptional regulator, transcriptional repressor for pyruvate dehydrogenase complex